MTFNATLLFPEDGNELVERLPVGDSNRQLRQIFVTKEIDAFLNSNEPYFPRASLETLIKIFCNGQLINVGRGKKKRRDKRADVSLVEGVDGVWALCFRQPKPGGRLLGRFISRNVFVGTGIFLRDELGGENYTKKSQEIVDNWSQITGGAEVVISDNLDDFFGETVFRDIDDDEA